MKKLIASLIVVSAATSALAQTNGLQNGSFDQTCYFCGSPFPEGWFSPGADIIARQRVIGDGLLPEFTPIGNPGLHPHSGIGVIEVGTRGNGGFEGMTTDSLNFCYCDQTCSTACLSPYPFFDPIFDYNGGDVVVSGWYMIPAGAGLVTDHGVVRIDVKVNNQDVATKEFVDIVGDTNGLWQPFTLTFSRADIQQQYECNRGILPECGCNCVPSSPLPNHTKITLGRFVGDGTPTSGTIYYDDVTYTQLPVGPTCDSIDFNNDTSLFDPQDIDAFLSVYSEGPCIPDTATCNDIDFNNDSSLFDPCDIDAFLLVFSEGPCTPCGS